MLRQISRKAIAALLAVCLIASMVTIGTVGVSANVIAEFAIDKLLDTGMRIASEAVEALGEATGNEDVEKAFSFINDWVFKDASEVAAEKTQELCEEILKELNYVEEQVSKGDSAISQLVSGESVNNAKLALSNQWTSDITDVLDKYGATMPFEKYRTYLTNAVGHTGTAREDLNNLLYVIPKMSRIGIDMNKSDEEILDQIYTDSTIVSSFESTIHDLAAKLEAVNPTTSVAECAARYAYLSYPFSHQQYTYVRNLMEKQVMYLILTEMMYNEFLFQQGEYFKNNPKYGIDSTEYAANKKAQSFYYGTLMNDSTTGANAKIANMLNYRMIVDSSNNIKISIDDYMRPEDAVSTKLSVNGYESEHDFYKELTKVAHNDKIAIQDGTNKSKAQYTKNKMLFKKVMTHTTSGNKVFYILDPEQFKGTDALYLKNLEHDVVVGVVDWLNPDCHTPTCDYLNFNKDMTDNVNTFHGINSYDCSNIDDLFRTNFFSAKGSTVSNCLGAFSEKYLPDSDTNPNTTKNYLISSMYRYDLWSSVNVGYAHIKSVDCSASFPGTDLLEIRSENDKDEISLSHAENNKSETFTVILGNKSSDFSQNVKAELTDSSNSDIQITSESGTTVKNGETKSIKSGEQLTIRFKTSAGFKALKVTRNSDVYENKGTVTETVLVDRDAFKMLKADDQGYYTLRYPAPYSSATFTLESVTTKYISNPQELIDFSNLVNSGDTDANGIVTADIDMKDYKNTLKPIGNGKTYSGVFEGNNHTISNLAMTADGSNYGLFGIMSGTIQNLTVSGEIDVTKEADSIGGIVGYSDGCTLEHIYCDIDISNRNSNNTLKHVGGIIGTVQNNETRINRCMYSGDMDIRNSVDCIGGIVGYSNGGARISNCAVTGSLYADTQDAFLGGVLGYVNNYDPTLESCYFDGTMHAPSGSLNTGEIIGLAKRCTAENVKNNYFVGIPDLNAFGPNSMGGLEACAEEMKNDNFESGMVTYQLNRKTTDGTQVWYQNIDNGKTPDKYPVFENDHGTVYCWDKYDGRYSNFEQKNLVASVVLSPDSLELYEGETAQITADLSPDDAEIKTLKWSSDNDNIASVDRNGLVTAKGEGTVKINATVDDGIIGATGSMTLRVYSGARPTEAPPTEAPTEAPTQAPTEAPTNDPSLQKFGIRTYQELCDFRDKVNSGEVTNAEAWLENNINAIGEAEWTQGIGTESNPFTGTFDGKDCCIIGLKINNSNNGALFEQIGNNGTVRDLMVFDCSYSVSSKNAGGIAAINNGTIDHCTSGFNLPSNKLVTIPVINKRITPVDYNSLIKGENSGGIAAINNGTITGCRNGSYVYGTYCGGIAAENNGKIFGCANNGVAGKSEMTCLRSGGIAGMNNASIESCYNSGMTNCGSDKEKGYIAGLNNSENINKVIYHKANGIPPVGSGTELNDSNKMVDNSKMQTDEFVDTLNGATGNGVVWSRVNYNDTYLNQKYPLIQGRYLEQRTIALADNLSVSGLMHKNMQFTVTELTKDSDEFKALTAGGALLSSYSVATTDENGNYIPAELWSSGGFKLTVPAKNSVRMVAQDSEGKLVTISPDSFENGSAVFTVADINSFAIVASDTPSPAPDDSDAKSSTQDSASKGIATKDSGSSTNNSNGTVKTGEAFPAMIVLTVMISVCALAFIRRKYLIDKT